jgi:multimeric flavodoxin WrbA
MRVLGYVGSPRRGGNTRTLVAQVLRGASGEGAAIHLCSLNDLHITPCQACDDCKTTGACRIVDDMTPQYEALRTADAIVLGTPIYWWGPSAQAKAFIDRWYAIEHLGWLKDKTLLLVCAYGDNHPDTARFAVGAMETSAHYLGMRFAPPLLASASAVGDAGRDFALMRRALAAGADLVRSLKG